MQADTSMITTGWLRRSVSAGWVNNTGPWLASKLVLMLQNHMYTKSDWRWARGNFPLWADECESSLLASNCAHPSSCTVKAKQPSEGTHFEQRELSILYWISSWHSESPRWTLFLISHYKHTTNSVMARHCHGNNQYLMSIAWSCLLSVYHPLILDPHTHLSTCPQSPNQLASRETVHLIWPLSSLLLDFLPACLSFCLPVWTDDLLENPVIFNSTSCRKIENTVTWLM